MNEFCRQFGVSIPIIQAPMGSLAGPELCRAVCEAGAMGSLGLSWTDESLAVERVRSLAGLPFLVNYVLHFEPKTLWPVVDAGAPVVGFSWGDPKPFLPELRRRGAKVAIQAGSVQGIRRFAGLEPDLLILQGIEAGGHVQSSTPLNEMIPAAVEAAGGIPLAVAGGLADGKDVAEVLRMGARAAVLGTRFLLADETDIHPEYQDAIATASSGDTVMSACYDGGWPFACERVLRNSTFEAWEAAGCPPPGARPGEGDVLAHTGQGEEILRYEVAAPRRETVGNIEAMCLYAGAGVGKVRERGCASSIVQNLWTECAALFDRAEA